MQVCLVCGLLWWLPILSIGLWQGWDSTLFQEGVFFSKAAVVTFGGVYAVLHYVAQQPVEHYHWLQPGQMLDGLGLAENTPGPLIIVLQFVGFMGGWQSRHLIATARCSHHHLGDFCALLSMDISWCSSHRATTRQ